MGPLPWLPEGLTELDPSAESDGRVVGVTSGELAFQGVGAAGRWEVVVDGVPAAAVMNEAEDDWVYGWISG